jgi:hypothetical protein
LSREAEPVAHKGLVSTVRDSLLHFDQLPAYCDDVGDDLPAAANNLRRGLIQVCFDRVDGFGQSHRMHLQLTVYYGGTRRLTN